MKVKVTDFITKYINVKRQKFENFSLQFKLESLVTLFLAK